MNVASETILKTSMMNSANNMLDGDVSPTLDTLSTNALAATEADKANGVGSVEASPVIVELFTSEGCSSCPPADQVLMRLDKDQPVAGANVIALSEHVDYWNRLGWRDPFSSAQFSARQSDYAEAFERDGVYTPQMIVDGRTEFVGSNMGRAREAIAQAARLPKAKVQLSFAPDAESRTSGGGRAIPLVLHVENIPAMSAGDTLEVMLAITESDLNSSVGAGENAGRSLRHTAVVRQLINIGNINEINRAAPFNAAPVINLAKGTNREHLRAVVFLQERDSRHLLGAAMLGLGR